MAMLRAELEAQRKQYEIVMKQNSDLLTTMARNGSGSGGGSGGGGGSGRGTGDGDNAGGGDGGQRHRGGGH